MFWTDKLYDTAEEKQKLQHTITGSKSGSTYELM